MSRSDSTRAAAKEQELQSQAEQFSEAVNAEQAEPSDANAGSEGDDIQGKLQQQYMDLQARVMKDLPRSYLALSFSLVLPAIDCFSKCNVKSKSLL